MKVGLAQGLVNLYQQKISRDYNAENGTHCLYTPSCSAYMKQAVQQEGLVDGVLDGLVRLSRCQKEVAESRLKEFLAPMFGGDAAEIGKLAKFETPEAEQRIRRIRSLVDQNRAAIAAGNLAEAAALQQTWTSSLRDDVKILVVDKPATDHNAPTQFVVEEKAPVAPPVTQGKHSALQLAASALVGIAGAVAGALAFGAMEMTAGAVMGQAACRGKQEEQNQKFAQKWGKDAITGLAHLRDTTSTVGKRTHGWLKAHTGSARLASAGALAIGMPCAVVAGLWDGIKMGAARGWQAGRILGLNLAGAQHPAGCPCCKS